MIVVYFGNKRRTVEDGKGITEQLSSNMKKRQKKSLVAILHRNEIHNKSFVAFPAAVMLRKDPNLWWGFWLRQCE